MTQPSPMPRSAHSWSNLAPWFLMVGLPLLGSCTPLAKVTSRPPVYWPEVTLRFQVEPLSDAQAVPQASTQSGSQSGSQPASLASSLPPSPPLPLNPAAQSSPSPVQSQGRYHVQGVSQLPDKSQIAVAAIRYLKSNLTPGVGLSPTVSPTVSPSAEPFPSETNPSKSGSLDERPTYSILDYQVTTVQRGRWQARLNLWRVAPDGRYQEVWQLQQRRLGASWMPEPEVVFLATLALPDGEGDRLQTIEAALARQKLRLSPNQQRLTLQGEQYFQATERLAIALPTGTTTPPQLNAQRLNGGWGERYLIPPEEPTQVRLAFPQNRTTNALGSLDELLK